MHSIHDSLLEAQREIDGFTFTQLDDPSRECYLVTVPDGTTLCIGDEYDTHPESGVAHPTGAINGYSWAEYRNATLNVDTCTDEGGDMDTATATDFLTEWWTSNVERIARQAVIQAELAKDSDAMWYDDEAEAREAYDKLVAA